MAAATTHSIEAFFFGTEGSRLYGVSHAALGGVQKRTGVLLAYPAGQEYMRAHRTYVQIANRLSRSGFHCMRFDYFGCGDSAGIHEEARLRRWLDDVDAAADELRRRTGCEAVCLAGLRLGASVAALAAARRRDVECILLWNPVVHGPAHLSELARVQQATIARSYAKGGPAAPGVTELLAYPFAQELLDEIAGVDLAAAAAAAATTARVIVLDSVGDASLAMLARQYESRGSQVRLRRTADSRIWLDEPFKAVVPGPVVQAISAEIAEACS